MATVIIKSSVSLVPVLEVLTKPLGTFPQDTIFNSCSHAAWYCSIDHCCGHGSRVCAFYSVNGCSIMLFLHVWNFHFLVGVSCVHLRSVSSLPAVLYVDSASVLVCFCTINTCTSCGPSSSVPPVCLWMSCVQLQV
jgi:hypothetical protein